MNKAAIKEKVKEIESLGYTVVIKKKKLKLSKVRLSRGQGASFRNILAKEGKCLVTWNGKKASVFTMDGYLRRVAAGNRGGATRGKQLQGGNGA